MPSGMLGEIQSGQLPVAFREHQSKSPDEGLQHFRFSSTVDRGPLRAPSQIKKTRRVPQARFLAWALVLRSNFSIFSHIEVCT
jgi:hypothetical protein